MTTQPSPHRRSAHLRLAAALLIGTAPAALIATPAAAQQATAALRGTITDQGQPAGTQVTAVNVDAGYRQVSPIRNGVYNFASLPPGRLRGRGGPAGRVPGLLGKGVGQPLSNPA